MRFLALLLSVLIVGCSKAPPTVKPSPETAAKAEAKSETPAKSTTPAKADTPAKPEAPAQLPPQPPRPDKTTSVVIEKIYVGCQPSQNEVIRVLGKLKGGIYDLTFHPKERQVRFQIGITDPDELYKHRFSRDNLENALRNAGLNAQEEFPEVKTLKVDRSDRGRNWKTDDYYFAEVFAGSPESQQALRDAFKPGQVAFQGDGPRKLIKISGTNLDHAETQQRLLDAGFRGRATAADDQMRVKISGPYLGCKPSQEAARQVLTKFPGVTDVSLDPKAKTILVRVSGKHLGNFLTSPTSGGDNVRPALNDIGLHVADIECVDPIEYEFKVIGGTGGIAPQPLRPAVTLNKVFVGSPESQESIRQILAPHKVTVKGDGVAKSIRVEGGDNKVKADELIRRLINAGFNAELP